VATSARGGTAILTPDGSAFAHRVRSFRTRALASQSPMVRRNSRREDAHAR
jgi:hypothetical protein